MQRSALDEPAGGCGVCTNPITTGIRAHDIISREFGRQGSFRLTDLPIGGGLVPGDDTPSPFRPRPDFIRLIKPNIIEVGELKPPLSIPAGEAQVKKYLERIKALFPKMVVRPLAATVPDPLPFDNPESPGCPPQLIGVSSLGGGLFVYFCSPTRGQLRALDPTGCRCGKKKEDKVPQGERVPVPVLPPVTAPGTLNALEKLLEELLEQTPPFVPRPAGAPIIVPKFDPCPFTDPRLSQVFCRGGPTASLCVPRRDVETVLGVRAPSPTATQSESTPPAPAGPPPADAAEFEGLARGDGLAFGTTDRRPRVGRLQGRLNEVGATLQADGMFGDATAQSLQQFQVRSGLPAGDRVDQATAQQLANPQRAAVPLSDLVGLRVDDGLAVGTFDRRPRVQRLQTRLGDAGFACVPDGMFGPKTLASLNGFQATRGLTTTDVVDPATADALEGRAEAPACDDDAVAVQFA